MSDEQPTPRRRRVAPVVGDPMAPYAAPPSPAPSAAPVVPPAHAPDGPVARAPEPPKRARSAPTVPVFLRTSETSKEQFEALAGAAGLTQRAMFEELVAQAWANHHTG